MARGLSNRIVVEVDAETKHDLYVALAKRGISLKTWFVQQAARYIHRDAVSSLPPSAPTARNRKQRARREVSP